MEHPIFDSRPTEGEFNAELEVQLSQAGQPKPGWPQLALAPTFVGGGGGFRETNLKITMGCSKKDDTHTSQIGCGTLKTDLAFPFPLRYTQNLGLRQVAVSVFLKLRGELHKELVAGFLFELVERPNQPGGSQTVGEQALFGLGWLPGLATWDHWAATTKRPRLPGMIYPCDSVSLAKGVPPVEGRTKRNMGQGFL